MNGRQVQLDPLEQQLLRFAIEHDGKFCVSAAQLREAITTGEADIPDKGPFSKGSALLEILEVKERMTGTSSGEEITLVERIASEKLSRVLGSVKES